MALYIFDVHDGVHVRDEVGQPLPDLEAVRMHAMSIAAEYAARPAMLGNNGGAILVVVRSATDDIVMNARLAFSIETRSPKAILTAKPG